MWNNCAQGRGYPGCHVIKRYNHTQPGILEMPAILQRIRISCPATLLLAKLFKGLENQTKK